MGTRGLTVVTYNNEVRVAQYGQWDHYPAGQGVTALEFLRNPENVEQLRKNMDKCYWIPQDKHEALIGEFSSSDKSGWVTFEEGKAFGEAYPSLTRDTGAEILYVIAEATEPVPLVNEYEFSKDDLMCEGIYSVDLDRNTFISEYAPYPTKVYDLDNLPTREDYLAAFKEEEEVNA